jgi:hypothetical protein
MTFDVQRHVVDLNLLFCAVSQPDLVLAVWNCWGTTPSQSALDVETTMRVPTDGHLVPALDSRVLDTSAEHFSRTAQSVHDYASHVQQYSYTLGLAGCELFAGKALEWKRRASSWYAPEGVSLAANQ